MGPKNCCLETAKKGEFGPRIICPKRPKKGIGLKILCRRK